MAAIEDDVKVVDLDNQDPEDVDFSKLKKKKKKIKPAAEKEEVSEQTSVGDAAPAEPEAETAAPAEGEDLDSMFGDMKKKKKKSKKVDFSEFEEGAAAGSSEAIEAEFDGMTKKKKKGKKQTMAEFEEALKGEEEEDTALAGISFGEGDEEESAGNDGREAWLGSNRDYTYGELLGRVFQNLRQFNPDLVGEKKKYTMMPPSIHREPKKTIFANLVEICRRMHRQPEHFIQFLFAELGTTGSVDGEQRLVIKGKFTQKQIEAIIRRYIMDYVQCKTCKSPDTILIKENRLFFQQCESCNSTRSVAAIKSGFKAQTEKRAAQRRAAG